MIIQNRDGSLVEQQRRPRRLPAPTPDYYAAVPAQLLDQQGSLIDRLIALAFDTLQVRRLIVRVYEQDQ